MNNLSEKIQEIKDKMEEIKPDYPNLTENQLRLKAIRLLNV